MNEYAAPRTTFNQTRYQGVQDGYHVLDCYSYWMEDRLVYRWSMRTPVADLPPDFPSEPQSPIRGVGPE